MNFVELAHASEAAGQQGSMLGMLLPFIAIFLVMYIFILRPQKKQQQKIEEMKKQVKKGDKIVTIAGIYGVIKDEKKDDLLGVEIAPNTVVTMTRSAIARKVEN